MEIAATFGKWILAVLEQWEYIVASGVIAFLVELGDKLLDKKMPKKWYVVFVAIGFVLATFKAWDQQRITADTAQHKLDDLTTPKLKLGIDQIGTGHIETTFFKGTGVLVFANLTNDGAPSVADSWLLIVTLPDGRHATTATTYLDPASDISFSEKPGVPNFKISQRDALYQKVGEHPVERGSRVRGILVFEFQGFSWEEASAANTMFVLRCNDVKGNLVQDTMIFTGHDHPLVWYPGLGPLKK